MVFAPPDYAPGIIAFVTMWDVIRDAGWQIDSAVKPRVPSYTKDIAPLFVRLAQNQWVNAGFGKLFGFRVDENLSALLPRLGDNSEFARPLRRRWCSAAIVASAACRPAEWSITWRISTGGPSL